MKSSALFSVLILILKSAFGHPIPDLPVFGSFEDNGSSSITLSIDTRCFEEDPESIPFLTLEQFQTFSAQQKKSLLEKAGEFVQKSLEVRINQSEWFLPPFSFGFEQRDAGELSEEDILVFVRGFSRLPSEPIIQNYQIRALEGAQYDLVFSNSISGVPQRRVNVLWPGEESFVLDLSSLVSQAEFDKEEESEEAKTFETIEDKGEETPSEVEGSSTFVSFLRQGFVHVLPLGLDHILFVLGIFMLSRKFRPLILQVSVFTVAHTITLALATLGMVSAPSDWVEPIIALSIAIVALENIFFPGYRPNRLLVVFVFGLIHGLGFAGALSAFSLDPTSLAVGLFGFNLGVEFGQIAVLLLAFGATFWIREEKTYRKYVVIPGSLMIAAAGIYWTIERIFF